MIASRGIALGFGLLLALPFALPFASSALASEPPQLLDPGERAIFRDGPVDVELTIASDRWPVWIEVDGQVESALAPWPPPSVRLEPGMHRLRVLDHRRELASPPTRVAVFPPKDEQLGGRERNGLIAVVASLIALIGATLLRRRGL
jgi:hypothetical protein